MPDIQKENSKIVRLCAEQNLIRSSCYSDTYRSEFSLNGEKHLWDIEKITIPFSAEKEENYMIRFGLSKKEMNQQYKFFRSTVKQHLEVNQILAARTKQSPEAGEKLRACTIFYNHRDLYSQGNGIEVYIVTHPVEPFVGSDLFKENGAYLSSILQIGIRLLQTAKTYNDNGFHAGAFDLESIFVVQGEKQLIKNSNFYAATGQSEDRPTAAALKCHTKNTEMFMKPEIAAGTEQPSFSGDIYSACAIMWSLLNGNHYTETPDIQFVPKYSFDEITECLVLGMQDGAQSYKDINRRLRAIAKELLEGDKEDIFISFKTPAYIQTQQEALIARKAAALKAEKEDAERKQAELDAEKTAEEKAKKKDRQKKIGGVIILTIAIIAALFILFSQLKPMLMSKTLDTPAQETVEYTEIDTPEPTPKPKPITATSEELGLYRYDGYIVDIEGKRIEEYSLDLEGNIINEKDDIVITSEKVKTYIYMTTIRIGKTSYDLQLVEQQDASSRGVITVSVSAGPSTTTNQTVNLKLGGNGEIYFPYQGNDKYMSDDFIETVTQSIKETLPDGITYETLTSEDLYEYQSKMQYTEISLDYAKTGGKNTAEIYVYATEEGLYDLTASDISEKLAKTSTINVYKEVKATPTPAPTPIYTPPSSGYTGGSGFAPSTPTTPTYTPPPATTPEPLPTYTEPVGMFLIVNGEFVATSEISLSVGDTYAVYPSESCTWSCSDPSVASLDQSTGKIIAYKVGTCIITAYGADGQATITIHVI